MSLNNFNWPWLVSSNPTEPIDVPLTISNRSTGSELGNRLKLNEFAAKQPWHTSDTGVLVQYAAETKGRPRLTYSPVLESNRDAALDKKCYAYCHCVDKSTTEGLIGTAYGNKDGCECTLSCGTPCGCQAACDNPTPT